MSWGSCYSPDFRVVSIIGAATLNTNQANDRRLVEALVGTPTFVLSSLDTGRYALHMDNTSAATSFNLSRVAAAGQYTGVLMRLKIPSFGANQTILRFPASTSTESIVLRVNITTGLLSYSFNNSSTFTNTAVTIAANAVYTMEAFVDFGVSTTHTLKVRINGVEVINVTGGAATSTSSDPVIGSAAIAAISIDVADCATYNDVAQYGTIGPDWRVIGLEPTADGAHSMTANDFQDDASGNLTNATTTSWSKVDDAPSAAPTVTDFVKQVVLRSTSFMEWQLRAMPAGYGNPVLVCLAAAMHPVASATANAVAFRLKSGSNISAEAAIDTSIASNTLEYRKHHYTTEPTSAAAWTTAMVQAPLRAQFGFDGTSITAPPALDSIMAFVLAPVSALEAGFRQLQAVNRASTY